MPHLLALACFFTIITLGYAFISIMPQFDASAIGPNVVVHDAVLVNSSQNLIISYYKNGA
jgi:hypothetical protein